MHDAVRVNVVHRLQHLAPDHSCEEWIQQALPWTATGRYTGRSSCHPSGRVDHRLGCVLLRQDLGQVDVTRLQHHGDVVAVPAHLAVDQLDRRTVGGGVVLVLVGLGRGGTCQYHQKGSRGLEHSGDKAHTLSQTNGTEQKPWSTADVNQQVP